MRIHKIIFLYIVLSSVALTTLCYQTLGKQIYAAAGNCACVYGTPCQTESPYTGN